MHHRVHRSGIVLATALLACQPSGTDRPHTALDPQVQQLRAAFNADSGMVRVIMLVSPT